MVAQQIQRSSDKNEIKFSKLDIFQKLKWLLQ